jgi:hypothetical protein
MRLCAILGTASYKALISAGRLVATGGLALNSRLQPVARGPGALPLPGPCLALTAAARAARRGRGPGSGLGGRSGFGFD